MQITVFQDKNNNSLNGCLPWWVLSGSIVQTYINLFLQSYKHSSWHMVCNGKTGPVTLPNSVIVLQLYIRDRKMWVVSLSVCVCVTDGCTASAVIAVYQAVFSTKRCFSESAEHNNLRKEPWLQAWGRQTLEYRLECQVCERSIGPSVYAC